MNQSLSSLPLDTWKPALERGAPVFVPVNPIEYHGPHLSLMADVLICDSLMSDIHAVLKKRHPDWPFLKTPDLNMGVSPAPGPGTQDVPYPEVKKHIQNLCAALADLGAQKVILMTFHGSPLHNLALESGLKLLQKRKVQAVSPLNLLTHFLLDYEPSRLTQMVDPPPTPAELEHAKLLDPQDYHAGCFETSLLLHYAPDEVRPFYRELPPCPDQGKDNALANGFRVMSKLTVGRLSKEFRFLAHALSWSAIRPYLGYTGKPHLASPEAGATFARLIVQAFAQLIEQVFAGQAYSPTPMTRWMPLLTLGGRIGNLSVADDEVWKAPK